jgi:hypothetical protein
MASVFPFCNSNAFSKYSLDEILDPFLSTIINVKSRTIQRKDGKYEESSEVLLVLVCMSLAKLITRFRVLMAF